MPAPPSASPPLKRGRLISFKPARRRPWKLDGRSRQIWWRVKCKQCGGRGNGIPSVPAGLICLFVSSKRLQPTDVDDTLPETRAAAARRSAATFPPPSGIPRSQRSDTGSDGGCLRFLTSPKVPKTQRCLEYLYFCPGRRAKANVTHVKRNRSVTNK